MRVRVSDPAFLPDLVDFLRSRVDAVVTEIADDEVEVALVGSYGTGAMRMELELRIRAWEAGRAGSVAVFVE